MAQIRTCAQSGCGPPAVNGSWCWACERERQAHHPVLGLIDWDDHRDFADCD